MRKRLRFNGKNIFLFLILSLGVNLFADQGGTLTLNPEQVTPTVSAQKAPKEGAPPVVNKRPASIDALAKVQAAGNEESSSEKVPDPGQSSEQDVTKPQPVSEHHVPEALTPVGMATSHPKEQTPAPLSGNTPAAQKEIVVVKRTSSEGQEAGAPQEIVVIESPKVEDPKVDKSIDGLLKTPRRVFLFLQDVVRKTDYARGVQAFDFSDFPRMTEQEKKEYVYKMDYVLSRITDLKPEEIPDRIVDNHYLFWPNLDYPPFELIKKGDRLVFSSQTIGRLNELYEKLEGTPPYQSQNSLLSFFPDSWYKKHYGLAGIQWFVLISFIIVGYYSGKLLTRILYYLTLAPFQLLEKNGVTYKVSLKMWQPIGWMITYTIWYSGIVIIKSPPIIADLVGYPIRFLAIIMCVMTANRIIDFASELIRSHARQNYTKLDEILVPIFSRSMKLLIIFCAVLMAFQLLGFSVIGLVSGMGIGGIAIALAAQNTIANFFGSITVLMDRPFMIGDWIVINGIEGEVETVGMRSTRIRTFYNSQITIPNNILTTATIDNMGRRHYRRYKTFIKVEYGTTPEKLELFCEGVRQLILAYPNTRKDVFHVYVNELGDFSIDILLICFFLVPDQASENKARATLLLDIMRLADKMGIAFAFPSQTNYNKSLDREPSLVPQDPDWTLEKVSQFTEELTENDLQKTKRSMKNS